MEFTPEQEKIAIAGKIMTALGEFVLDFLKILEKYTNYVIVSGYIGMDRQTLRQFMKILHVRGEPFGIEV